MTSFLAPVFLESSDGVVHRSVGLSTQLPCVLPPGMSLKWPPIYAQCELATETTTKSWKRERFAVVPPGGLDPLSDTVVLHRISDGTVFHALPVRDKRVEKSWDVVEVAHYPDGWLSNVERFYEPPMLVELYPLDFRVRVTFEKTNPEQVPPTWRREE